MKLNILLALALGTIAGWALSIRKTEQLANDWFGKNTRVNIVDDVDEFGVSVR